MSHNSSSDQQFAEINKRLSNIEDLVKGTLTSMTIHFDKLGQILGELVESNKKISSDVKTLVDLYNLPDETIVVEEIEEDPVEDGANKKDPEMFSVEPLNDEADETNVFFETIDSLDEAMNTLLDSPSSTGLSMGSNVSSSIDLEEVSHVKCDACGMLFVRGSLTYSIRKHQRETSCKKPYKCPYCDKFFAQNKNRKKHMITHGEHSKKIGHKAKKDTETTHQQPPEKRAKIFDSWIVKKKKLSKSPNADLTAEKIKQENLTSSGNSSRSTLP